MRHTEKILTKTGSVGTHYTEKDLIDYIVRIHRTCDFPCLEMNGQKTTFKTSHLVWLQKCMKFMTRKRAPKALRKKHVHIFELAAKIRAGD